MEDEALTTKPGQVQPVLSLFSLKEDALFSVSVDKRDMSQFSMAVGVVDHFDSWNRKCFRLSVLLCIRESCPTGAFTLPLNGIIILLGELIELCADRSSNSTILEVRLHGERTSVSRIPRS